MGLLHINTFKMRTAPVAQEHVVSNVILESKDCNTEQINESTDIGDKNLSVRKEEPMTYDVSSVKMHDAIPARYDISSAKIHDRMAERHGVLGNSPAYRKSYAAISMS